MARVDSPKSKIGYVEDSTRIARLEERVEGIRNATAVAKTEVDRRLDEMNELRHQIEAERGQYVSTVRYEERHEEIQLRLNVLENRVAAIEGGTAIKAGTIGWALAGMGLVLTVVVVIVNLFTSGSV